MKILIVEDDLLLHRELRSALAARHGHLSLNLISTERAFVEAIPALEESPPNLILMDVMLPWDYPRPDLGRITKQVGLLLRHAKYSHDGNN